MDLNNSSQKKKINLFHSFTFCLSVAFFFFFNDWKFFNTAPKKNCALMSSLFESG